MQDCLYRCSYCGKYLKYEKMHVQYVPDSEQTVEQLIYTCESCTMIEIKEKEQNEK